MYNSNQPLDYHEQIEADILNRRALIKNDPLVALWPYGRERTDGLYQSGYEAEAREKRSTTMAACRLSSDPKIPLEWRVNRRPTRPGLIHTDVSFLMHSLSFLFIVQCLDGLYEAVIDPARVEPASWDAFDAKGNPDFCRFYPVDWFRKID